MRGVYRMRFEAGRNGVITSVFVADSADVAGIIGKDLDFGEALGKHSEIVGYLQEHELQLVTDDQDFVDKFERYNVETGRNPFNYIAATNDDNEDE